LLIKIENDYPNTFLSMLIFPFNAYALVVALNQGFQIYLKKAQPTIFCFDFKNKNHWLFNDKKYWVPLIKKSNSFKETINSNQNEVILESKEDNFNLLENHTCAKMYFPDDKKYLNGYGWLIDKISGNLLITSIFTDVPDKRVIPIEMYNDYSDEEKVDKYYKYGKIISANDYKFFDKEVKKCLKIIKKRHRDKCKIINIGAGRMKIEIDGCEFINIDKNNPIDLDDRKLFEIFEGADMIIAKNFFIRMFDYKNNRDYDLIHKITFFERIINDSVFNNRILLILETEILNVEKIDKKNIELLLSNKYGQLIPEKDRIRWASFWWYALADNIDLISEFAKVLKTFEDRNLLKKNTIRVPDRHSIREGVIWAIYPKYLFLYDVFYADVNGNLRSEVKSGFLDEGIIKKYEKQIPSERISSLLTDYYISKKLVNNCVGTFLFAVIRIPLKYINGSGITNIYLNKYAGGFFIYVDPANNKVSDIRIWGENKFPVYIIQYYIAIFSKLIEMIKEKRTEEKRDCLISITIARFIGEFHGFTSYSLNLSLQNTSYFKSKYLFEIISNVKNRLTLKLESFFIKLFMSLSLKTAISAIMGRNMSHNIGSHVMARISTGGIDGWTSNKTVNDIIKELDVGTHRKDIIEWSKDVQYLSRYIQQRMDFIAQISTEWPSWTEPAYLMNDLMRWFLSQKHLLNNIAVSEGLKAHSFLNDETIESKDISSEGSQTSAYKKDS
jgi:hypothetical protein